MSSGRGSARQPAEGLPWALDSTHLLRNSVVTWVICIQMLLNTMQVLPSCLWDQLRVPHFRSRLFKKCLWGQLKARNTGRWNWEPSKASERPHERWQSPGIRSQESPACSLQRLWQPQHLRHGGGGGRLTPRYKILDCKIEIVIAVAFLG